ncbi:MAG: hypothetical protein GQ533_01495 [Methanosarcinaceae archaeon]|nr:hypothetical protein [Methanosarcinaceae archaeon]
MKKILMLITLIMMINSADAIGIGLSPGEMVLNNSLKGNTYEKSFAIINMDNQDINYSLSSNGDIEGWVSFYYQNPDTEIQSIIVPANGKISVITKFQIPTDAVSKDYFGTINVRSVPEIAEDSGSQQSLIIGGSVKINVNVTGDQIIDGVVNGISIYNIEPGYPLKVETMFRNTGNVVANPEIKITILKDNELIHSFIYDKATIKPSITNAITAEWKTTEETIPGDYTANVIVSLDGKTLRSSDKTFKIFPVGTYSRQGNLTDIRIEGEPTIGSLVKVNAYFENTGEIETAAKFSGEVYKDGNLIDTITSEELQVEKYKEAELVSYFKLESKGDYLIKGKVIYSGKETPVKEVSLKAGKSTPGFEGIYLIAVMLLFVMFRGKKKSRKM